MKILVAADIDADAIGMLKEHHDVDLVTGLEEDELADKARDYEVIVVRSKPKVTKKIIDNALNLKLIARAGVGLDNIDLKECEKRKIKVVNSPLALSESVAELVFAMILSFERKIVKSDNSMKKGLWKKKELKGKEIFEKTIGIIGFGRIGSHIAMIANGFGMNVLAYDIHWNKELAEKYNVKFTPMDDLLRESDFITLHVPLLPQTKGMISKNELKSMKNSAVLINTSRGGIVNENDLYNALRQGDIRGACLDVYENEPPGDSPLLALDSVILTPHIGASTDEAQKKAGLIIAEKIIEEFGN